MWEKERQQFCLIEREKKKVRRYLKIKVTVVPMMSAGCNNCREHSDSIRLKIASCVVITGARDVVSSFLKEYTQFALEFM